MLPAAAPFASFTFGFTLEDLKVLHREFIDVDPRWRAHLDELRSQAARQLAWCILCLIVFGLALGLAASGVAGTTRPAAKGVVGLVAIASLGVAGRRLYDRQQLRRRIKVIAQGTCSFNSTDPAFCTGAVRTLELSEDGVRLVLPDREVSCGWAAVSEPVELPSFVLMEGPRRALFAIPRSQFSSPQAVDELASRIHGILAGLGPRYREGVPASGVEREVC